jgi:hypothetical protein
MVAQLEHGPEEAAPDERARQRDRVALDRAVQRQDVQLWLLGCHPAAATAAPHEDSHPIRVKRPTAAHQRQTHRQTVRQSGASNRPPPAKDRQPDNQGQATASRPPKTDSQTIRGKRPPAAPQRRTDRQTDRQSGTSDSPPLAKDGAQCALRSVALHVGMEPRLAPHRAPVQQLQAMFAMDS